MASYCNLMSSIGLVILEILWGGVVQDWIWGRIIINTQETGSRHNLGNSYSSMHDPELKGILFPGSLPHYLHFLGMIMFV